MTDGPAKKGERNVKAKYFQKEITLKSGLTRQVAAQKSDSK